MSAAPSIDVPRLEASGLENPWSIASPADLSHYLWLDNGYMPFVQARLFHTDSALHIRFQVQEEKPLVSCRKPNEPVYEDSCVELFLQPAPESDARYLNFEMNAAGTLLLQIGESRHDRHFIPATEHSQFNIKAESGCRLPDGTAYWQVELSIPYSWLQSIFSEFQPAVGCTMRGNLYKCGDRTELPHYGCWSLVTSPTPDYHRSGDFGYLVLGS
jgi:hypothetical protein